MRASHARRLVSFLVVSAIVVTAGPAFALPEDPDEQKAGGAGPTPLEQAREESAVTDRPRTSYALPAGVLRLSRSELLATAHMDLELSLTLERDVAAGTLEVTLPRQWIGRSGVSGLAYARVPSSGRASSDRAAARRSDRVVRLEFDGGRTGDAASFELKDNGIPGGTYRLPYRWRDDAGNSAAGTVTVIFYNPVREEAAGDEEQPGWDVFIREVNATNDISTESETFMTVVPGNSQRFVVGANGGGGYNAWITNDGGGSFTRAPMSSSIDAPGEAPPETGVDLCCDPMSAADAAGNIWYGGLSQRVDSARPSRIIVARSAPGTSTLLTTVGLPERTNAGTQDKPMMTIDNSPSSPAFGRIYVVWGEPTGKLVLSVCDTRPGGVLNAANCDNADNWTTPVDVTPTGSFIYADVATGPGGKVYIVWWDYSAANAIRGDVCDPASQNCAAASGWGLPQQTIASLDFTGSTPIPFACPILAQPGGRASTSPQVDVDRSGGPNNNRVYVTWSDLRTGSGTTKCGGSTVPAATHLAWDNFVASAVNALPGSAAPSPTVATRLLTDGEGGGQANSDDWFAWLAVDQSNGQAWADFYSTRDDSTRKTTNFYVRSVTPSGGSHTLGTLRKVSTAASDYSANPCCGFGNDYGDYTGIDATDAIALPTWSDRRAPPSDGEAFIDVVPAPLALNGQTFDDSAAAGGDGDGVLERGESFRLTAGLRNTGLATATGVSATLVAGAGSGLTITQASSAYPNVASSATQSNTTAFAGALTAGAPCGAPAAMFLPVITATEPVVVRVTVPTLCPPVVSPPAPPPPAPPPVAPPPVAPPPLPAPNTLVFALTGSTTQEPLTKNVGLKATLSCPLESCTVSVTGTLTIPSTKKGAKAKKYSLKGSTAKLTAGKKATVVIKLSKKLSSLVSSRLRRTLTRTKVSALVTAKAVDALGLANTKNLTIKVNR